MAPPPNYRAIATQKARQYGVPVDVFLRQIQQESGFGPDAHSGAGADGIAQFIPSTAKAYGVNTRDPVSSLDGAARYDRDLLKQYGSIERALSAYNSGRPDAYKDPGFAHGQTYNYVRSILGGAGHAAQPAQGGALAAALAAPPQAAPSVDPKQLLSLYGGDSGAFYAKLGQVLASKRAGAAAPVAVAPNPLNGLAQPPQPNVTGTGGLAELIHEGVGGPTHSTGEHIHAAFTDPQAMLAAIRKAQQFGLSVRENPYTDPVDPVHAPNSFHNRNFPGKYNGRTLGEAEDVSGDRQKMAAYEQWVKATYGGRR